MKVNPLSYQETIHQIIKWITEPQGRYLCLSNVHMCMESFDQPDFCEIIDGADLVLPDGKPIVWALRLLGIKNATQVRGPDLMPKLFPIAEQQGLSIGFYGGSPQDISALKKKLSHDFPKLKLACAISPPFRPLTLAEETAFIDEINHSGTQILFVILGCPKQERWMATHRNKLSCVMLGVGAALNFYLGHQKHAPYLLRIMGLEWLHRLYHEPRRLWKRYLKHNPRFILYLFLQWMQTVTKKPRIEKT